MGRGDGARIGRGGMDRLAKGEGAVLEVPGAFEVIAAREFFRALATRDVRSLLELLDERPSFANMDGPVAVAGRAELAQSLARHGDDVEYQLAEVEGAPGVARARFVLVVEGVPGGIV